MAENPISEESFKLLKSFFEREVCGRATKPLRDGIEIAVFVGGSGPATLSKSHGRVEILSAPPKKPDMTFDVAPKGLLALSQNDTEDIGEIGIAILSLMANSDPELRMTAKVHIGLFDILRNGYLSVLPLGGPSVMKFLANKGFSGIGKIREAMARMRA